MRLSQRRAAMAVCLVVSLGVASAVLAPLSPERNRTAQARSAQAPSPQSPSAQAPSPQAPSPQARSAQEPSPQAPSPLARSAQEPSPQAPSPLARSAQAQTGDFFVTTWGRATGPGGVITHSVVISPVGSIDDTITFTAEGNRWPLEAPSVALTTGAKVTTILTVTIPLGTEDRTYDTADVTASGQQSGARRSFTLTSRTGGAFRVDRYMGCRFDLDRDGELDQGDVDLVAARQGAGAGSDAYVRYLDLDGSGRIDDTDVRAVTSRVGATCRTLPDVDSDALQDAVTADRLRVHLEGLMAVATANGGNRAVGSSGFAGSLDYVEGALAQAGLVAVRQEFRYPMFEILQTPRAQIVAPEPRDLGDAEIRLLRFSGSGDVTAEVQAVDVQVPPGPAADSSTSGCEASDFAAFTAGAVALVQRGSCSFGHKARLAEQAGAGAVVVFNEGQDGRRAVFDSNLDGPEATIPAFSAGYGLGEELVQGLRRGDDVVLHLVADTVSVYRPSFNLIAELPGARADAVLLGAHLDSVEAGPGINDNGSGAAVVLEVARQMSLLGVHPTNTVRFAFWGAEEIGLVGSSAYASSLTPTERRRTLLNLNYDMLGSTNWSRLVYEGAESPTADRPEGSAEIEAAHVRHFSELGMPVMTVNIDGRSDHGSFTDIGIPAGGLHTGTSVRKSETEEFLFGGAKGEPYDPCYHEACDTVENVDWQVLEEMADAVADVTLGYALDDDFAYRRAGDELPARPAALHLPYASR